MSGEGLSAKNLALDRRDPLLTPFSVDTEWCKERVCLSYRGFIRSFNASLTQTDPLLTSFSVDTERCKERVCPVLNPDCGQTDPLLTPFGVVTGWCKEGSVRFKARFW